MASAVTRAVKKVGSTLKMLAAATMPRAMCLLGMVTSNGPSFHTLSSVVKPMRNSVWLSSRSQAHRLVTCWVVCVGGWKLGTGQLSVVATYVHVCSVFGCGVLTPLQSNVREQVRICVLLERQAAHAVQSHTSSVHVFWLLPGSHSRSSPGEGVDTLGQFTVTLQSRRCVRVEASQSVH